MAKQDVEVQAWHLEFVQGSSSKFYDVYLTSNGWCVLVWGKLGTRGQSSWSSVGYDQAEDMALKQVYAKKAKGYQQRAQASFLLSRSDIDSALANEDQSVLSRARDEALMKGIFVAEQEVVSNQYDEFAERVKRAMAKAGTLDNAAALSELEDVENAWTLMCKKHAEVEVAVSILRTTVAQKVFGA